MLYNLLYCTNTTVCNLFLNAYRMMANAGYPVVELHRTRYGNIVMGSWLKLGECAPVKGDALQWARWLKRTPEKKLLETGPHPVVKPEDYYDDVDADAAADDE